MKKRKWQDEEINYLRDSVGSIKISTIARNLNRSDTAVILKMKRLGLSNTKEAIGSLTMHQLAGLLDVDPTVVKLWIQKHGLPYQKRVTRSSRKFYFIDQLEFWAWAELNKERIDFSKVIKNSIVPEPKWVDVERRKKREVAYRNWTTGEVKLMLHLHTSGDNFHSISKHLNRSVVSVKRKYQRTMEQR
ncbi:DNA-binding protein [Aquibacillus salsiterrae]|uniref:DNA-binding protein n=1 Tax=Aquibacillus salsiterrae TaxID=2950439 RepID=A0A9X3WFB0_9BACI|nr:DNA-binding protein [Aquibacillus salsiterrae]MDC3415996.1 DNA-binding protein [Aquibacillus salsiterrae]